MTIMPMLNPYRVQVLTPPGQLDGGFYSLVGADVAIKYKGHITALSSSYTLTGQTVTLQRRRTMAIGTSTYALTGTAATPKRTRKITAGTSSYALTGQPVTFTWAASIQWEDTATSNTSASTHTLSAMNIGTASSQRAVLVIFYYQGLANRSVSSATIGGISASIINGGSGSAKVAAIIATVPTGTTADVVINFSGTVSLVYASSLATYKLLSLTPVDSQTDTTGPALDLPIDITAGGVAAALAVSYDGAMSGWSWTNLTERKDETFIAATNRASTSCDALGVTESNRAISASGPSGATAYAGLSLSFR